MSLGMYSACITIQLLTLDAKIVTLVHGKGFEHKYSATEETRATNGKPNTKKIELFFE